MTLTVKPGMQAPDFQLENESGDLVSLSEHRGKWLVLYFYPRDLTPGCTVEAIDFSTQKDQFESLNCLVWGVSPDSAASHRKFTDKKELQITLLSDPERDMIQTYGVWQKKKMAGREYMGVVRSTLLIDEKGTIRQVWEKVRVKGHVETVLQALKDHQAS